MCLLKSCLLWTQTNLALFSNIIVRWFMQQTDVKQSQMLPCQWTLSSGTTTQQCRLCTKFSIAYCFHEWFNIHYIILKLAKIIVRKLFDPSHYNSVHPKYCTSCFCLPLNWFHVVSVFQKPCTINNLLTQYIFIHWWLMLNLRPWPLFYITYTVYVFFFNPLLFLSIFSTKMQSYNNNVENIHWYLGILCSYSKITCIIITTNIGPFLLFSLEYMIHIALAILPLDHNPAVTHQVKNWPRRKERMVHFSIFLSQSRWKFCSSRQCQWCIEQELKDAKS